MKKDNSTLFVLLLVVCLVCNSSGVTFTTNTTIGSGNTTYDNQDIIISNCTVTIDGTHTFSSLQIVSGGTLTHTAMTPTPMNLTINGNTYVDTLSFISANGKGYPGSTGPGKGSDDTIHTFAGAGGGHGGNGGTAYYGNTGGSVYGSVTAPTLFGSGGGSAGMSGGGAGGGSVQLMVGGTLTVDGFISADGSMGSGGGSGGSVYLNVNVLEGVGAITAKGGNASNEYYGGGGGGGRIAIYYGSKDSYWGNIIACGQNGCQDGGAGTLYLKSNAESLGHLIIDNDNHDGTLTPLPAAFSCTDVIIRNYGKMDINAAEILTVTDRVTVDNKGFFFVHATQTLPYLHVLSGGEVGHDAGRAGFNLIVSGNLNVDVGGAISVNTKGYGPEMGPGQGTHDTYSVSGSGAGYGGAGGAGNSGNPGGITYGSATAPTLFGSGGGSTSSGSLGGAGGGLVRLTVMGTLTVNGKICSNGGTGAGGGSGGSVYLSVGVLEGTGDITAKGADANTYWHGGGGGGRIAIYTATYHFIGNVLVNGGSGYNNGQNGTIYYGPSDFGCGDATRPHPTGDLYPDCIVDLLDFAIFAQHWLEDTN